MVCNITFLFAPGRLENYHLGDVIGYGSFGQVVAATRQKDNLPVKNCPGIRVKTPIFIPSLSALYFTPQLELTCRSNPT